MVVSHNYTKKAVVPFVAYMKSGEAYVTKLSKFILVEISDNPGESPQQTPIEAPKIMLASLKGEIKDELIIGAAMVSKSGIVTDLGMINFTNKVAASDNEPGQQVKVMDWSKGDTELQAISMLGNDNEHGIWVKPEFKKNLPNGDYLNLKPRGAFYKIALNG